VCGYSATDRGLIGSHLLSDGSLWKLLHMHAPKSYNPDLVVENNNGTYIQMEGREVFKHAVKAMADSVKTLLQKEKIELDSVDLFIPHQANIRILNNLVERLKVPRSKVFINVPKCGNTSAASIPIALDEANNSGLIADGDTVLLCSFGGGLTWGAALIKW